MIFYFQISLFEHLIIATFSLANRDCNELKRYMKNGFDFCVLFKLYYGSGSGNNFFQFFPFPKKPLIISINS
jgi:hypothetical protein